MINRTVIENFKSIRHRDLELRPLNILIGANGSGKSNLISFFEMLRAIAENDLQSFIARNGHADKILHFGMKRSPYLKGSVTIAGRPDQYEFELRHDKSYQLYFEKEELKKICEDDSLVHEDIPVTGRTGSKETSLIADGYNTDLKELKQIGIYHFPDSSLEGRLRQMARLHDNRILREDGSNLPAILFYLQVKHPLVFNQIEGTIRSVSPFFKSFDLNPNKFNDNQILLEWRHDFVDEYFNAQDLSDGSLRMIALTTLLLQPELPKLLIIDEPELGLHPFAIHKLAALMQIASQQTQIIVATQSPSLVANFEPEDIVTVDWENGQSVFKRHNTEELEVWLEDYSMGEIWEKNLIGGRP